MPRNKLIKDEIKAFILQLKNQINSEYIDHKSKELTNQYLNQILNKLEEYRF
jgi:hypothetical protein